MKKLLFAVALMMSASGLVATRAASELRLLVSTPQGIGTVYIKPPTSPASYLALVGEPLTVPIEIDVVNTGEMSQVMIARQRNIDVVARSVPDGQVINVPVSRLPSPTRVFGTSESIVAWDERMSLSSHERLKWTMDVTLDSVPPGIYLLEVVMTANDGNGDPVMRWAPAVYVEIRDDDSTDAAKEIAIRSAIRLQMAKRTVEAVDVAAQAATRYPDSVAIQNVLGDLYTDLGRSAEAVRSYSRALVILQANGDRSLSDRLSPEERAQLLLRVRTRVARQGK